LEQLDTFGVASVFVPKEYRSRGYATIMTQLLRCQLCQMLGSDNKMLKEWGQVLLPLPQRQYPWGGEELVLSHLYSDIGPAFYQRFGWFVYNPKEMLVDVARSICDNHALSLPSNEAILTVAHKDGWKPLQLRNHSVTCLSCDKETSFEEARLDELLGSLLDQDLVKISKADLRRHPSHYEGGDVPDIRHQRVLVVPTMDAFLWHWRRAQFYLEQLRSQSLDSGNGVLVGLVQREQALTRLILWTYDIPNKSLVILYSFPADANYLSTSTVAILLSIARLYSLERIVWWDAPDSLVEKMSEVVSADPNGQGVSEKVSTRERESSLPSFAMWTSKKDKLCPVRVDWVNNAKYAWL
jgi:hypothetical protein